jgi:hypothetical protein
MAVYSSDWALTLPAEARSKTACEDTTCQHCAILEAREKHLASLATGMESHFNSVGNHRDGKTGNVVVSLWGATLAMLIAAASALTKLL